jgi:hypothetical protein
MVFKDGKGYDSKKLIESVKGLAVRVEPRRGVRTRPRRESGNADTGA